MEKTVKYIGRNIWSIVGELESIQRILEYETYQNWFDKHLTEEELNDVNVMLKEFTSIEGIEDMNIYTELVNFLEEKEC